MVPIPELGRHRQVNLWGSPAGPAYLVSSRRVRGPVSKQTKQSKTKNPNKAQKMNSACLHVHVDTHTHVYINTECMYVWWFEEECLP